MAAWRHWNGRLGNGAAAFVTLNDEGWIITAAHVIAQAVQADNDRPKVEEILRRIGEIEAGTDRPDVKARQLKRLRGEADAGWITDISFWWARNGVSLQDLVIVNDADIAVGRLDPYQPTTSGIYPKIQDPANVKAGRSLCRLGFPFQQADVRFDEETGFEMDQEWSLFPLDGIMTRTLEADTLAAGKYPLKWVETSSPGLMGQSGGPLFDAKGNLWGIQSRTRHRLLGFKTEQNQVINLGEAVHSETLLAILDDIGVKYELSAD